MQKSEERPRPSSRSGLGSGLAFPRPAGWLGLGPVSAGRGQAGGRARPNHRPWSPVARPGPASAPAWLSQAAGLRNPHRTGQRGQPDMKNTTQNENTAQQATAKRRQRTKNPAMCKLAHLERQQEGAQLNCLLLLRRRKKKSTTNSSSREARAS